MKGRHHAFLIGAGWLGLCLSIHGQAPIKYHRFAPTTHEGVDSPYRPDVKYHAAEAKLKGGTFDPAAEPFLKGAEAFTKGIFIVPSLRFQGAVTEHIPTGPQRGDVLIVEWSFEEKFGRGSLILTDTPYYGTIDMRLSDCKISSEEGLNSLIVGMLGWAKSTASNQGGLPPMNVSLPSGEITYFSGSKVGPSPYSRIADFQFSGFLENGQWFIDFGVGKMRATYPVPNYIPERFPPLGDRIKSWTFTQIRNAIGDPVKPWEGVPAFTATRDQILIAELAHRGLSHDQVVELLRDVEPTEAGYYMRLGSVINGFRDAGEEPFTNRYFEQAMEAYESIGPIAGQSVSILLGDIALRKCSADFEGKAIELVKGRRFSEAGFRYFRLCSNSSETIATIEALPMPTEYLEKEKQATVQEIRRHIAYPSSLRKPSGN